MRHMALPPGESGAKSLDSISSAVIPSWAALASSIPGVRSVRVVPGWMQLTVMPNRPIWLERVLVRWTMATLRAPPLRFPAVRPLPPLMLTMRPQPCSFMKGIAARAQRRAPAYLTSKSLIKSSSLTVSMGPTADAEPPGREALLTRMCRPPMRSAAAATTRSTCARSVTSTAMAVTDCPVSSAISWADLSNSSRVRETITTSAPSRASSLAMALPMPRPPPATRDFLPASPKSISQPPPDVHKPTFTEQELVQPLYTATLR